MGSLHYRIRASRLRFPSDGRVAASLQVVKQIYIFKERYDKTNTHNKGYYYYYCNCKFKPFKMGNCEGAKINKKQLSESNMSCQLSRA